MAGDVQICIKLEGAKGQRSKAKKKDRDRSNAGLRGQSHTEESGDRVPAEELKRWSRRLTFVRVFLHRMGRFLGTPSHSVGFASLLCTVLMQNMQTSLTFVNHLLSPPSSMSSPLKALTNVTLDLIQLYVMCVPSFSHCDVDNDFCLRSLLRSQEPEAAASIPSVISTLVAAKPFSQPNSQETWAQLVVQSIVLKLIERLTRDFDPAGYGLMISSAC